MPKHNHSAIAATIIAFGAISSFFLANLQVEAALTADSRQKYEDAIKQRDALEKEIEALTKVLDSTSREAQSYATALKQLELAQKRLETNLKLTSTQISKTSITLDDIKDDIDATEVRITSTSAAVSENIRNMSMAESESVLEELLANKTISGAWDYINALHSVGNEIKIQLEDLRDERMFLGAKRDQMEGEKAKLESYRKTLSAESKAIESTKAEKDRLLKAAEEKKESYEAMIEEKRKEKEAFERELFAYESQLKISLDPSAIPGARSGILSWPVSNVSVTQYFGKTVAARRLYTSGSHGGIDLRASIGTKIRAALSGTVLDTEAVRSKSGCQYGKWVLIRHPNGLTTIYGHLSAVSVSPGDVVLTGDVIGLSGDTGYATGPHLHFGVYASQGVRIVDSSSVGSARCSGIKTVAAPTSAYLDPSAYLPRP
jgi:murein DD-endopeptidase MepM/ murein hydrolase activator NlpD